MKRIYTSLIIALFLLPLNALAQSNSLKSPAEFLGYELGEHFTYHHQLVSYFEHVAANSPLVELEYYGHTYERRPLLIAYVSNAQNIENKESIRASNLRRAGVLDGTPGSDQKAIVWLSYNIHGNESVSMEASMQTIYELVSPDFPHTKEWLDNTLVIIDPTINPDGRDRYSIWFNQVVGKQFNPDPIAREHQEPWPGGRANHYLFDLNRDWAWQTQLESQLRGVIYQKWLPHVHGDFHEMGGYRYYFAPAAKPYHESITQWQRDFQVTIGKNIARNFDMDHRLYFTREVFDLFYPSYGDTWPTYQGAIGMTFEQGGGGRAGLGILTERGDTLTLKDRISNQHLAGMATVEVVAMNYSNVVNEFASFYDRSRNNPQTRYKSFILRVDGNHDNVTALLDLLDLQGIQYGRAPARRNIQAFNYATGSNSTVSTSDNDIVISMYQPKSTLAHILMEPRTTIVDSLTYDITAWALPYVYGVEAYASTERLNPSGDARDVLNIATIQGFEEPVVAYLFKWNSFDDARFLAALHKNGFRVRSTAKPITIGSQTFDRGTIVISKNGNERFADNFDSQLRRLAGEYNRIPTTVSTGFATSGVDLGSESVRHLNAPRVAVLSGSTVSSLAFGEVWHYFEQQLDYPLTVIDVSAVTRANLHEFDVIILPQGSYSDFLGSSSFDNVSSWIRGGGRLIAMEGVISQLAGKRGLEDIKMKEPNDNKEASIDSRLKRFEDQERESMSSSLAGGIFKVNIDNSHPLGFGYTDTYFTLKRSTTALEYLSNGWNVGHVPKGGLTSGFVGSKIIPKLEETLAFGVVPMGRGQVIVMVDNPLFRGFWYNGRLLFANSVFQSM
jgi:hypothetical protein